jgi:hypothetical protein
VPEAVRVAVPEAPTATAVLVAMAKLGVLLTVGLPA